MSGVPPVRPTSLRSAPAFSGADDTPWLVPDGRKLAVVISGLVGVLVYIGVDWISDLLEEAESSDPAIGKLISQGSIGGFLYLEVLDASFSFDGVIGELRGRARRLPAEIFPQGLDLQDLGG